jgi:3-oxoacyl-(acyl-carrier-protein) synthase
LLVWDFIMTEPRVVVTGMGVISPIGNTLGDFEASLRAGRSGISQQRRLSELNFRCRVAGVPDDVSSVADSYFDEEDRMAMNSCMTYAAIAALDAWVDAGLPRREETGAAVLWDTGAILGSGSSGADTIGTRVVPLTDAGKPRRLGSFCAEQMMSSNLSAKVGGLLALGNQVSSNSSACATGAEAIFLSYDRIRSGLASRMLAGGSEGISPYIWSPFDAMRLLADRFNDQPEAASRPMSASACGFVPSAGAGVLVLEDLEVALERGARIHAEILGGAVNCGGQRQGGTMTAPNSDGVRRCIRLALADAGLRGDQIGAISGHLTGTMADPIEIGNWAAALGKQPEEFPWITAPKSLFGHGLGAAGAIESIAAILMLRGGYVHPSINCENLHPDIEPFADSVPHELQEARSLQFVMKAGFGFGDVNCCLALGRWRG